MAETSWSGLENMQTLVQFFGALLLPKDTLLRTYLHYYVSEYDHEIQQSNTTDQPTALLGGATKYL